MLAPSNVFAVDKQKKAEREVKKEMKRKAYKDARKEATRYKRKGWYVAPGASPMDKQIEKSWELQYQEDENGYPLYIVATGNSVGPNTICRYNFRPLN
ncbi:MAG: hypothetical protein U5K79_04110 [Cyclobacteriaceae bacterium]|nr:hypothetical protein [Cyclobacteriaceae bacterium]